MAKPARPKRKKPPGPVTATCTGRELVAIRKKLGWTQRELGLVLGIKPRAIQEWERDKAKSRYPVYPLFKYLGVRPVQKGVTGATTPSPPYEGFIPGSLDPAHIAALSRDLVREIDEALTVAKLPQIIIIMISLLGALQRAKSELQLSVQGDPPVSETETFALVAEEGYKMLVRYLYNEVQDGERAPNVRRRLRYRGKEQMQRDWDEMTEPRTEESCRYSMKMQAIIHGVLHEVGRVAKTLPVPDAHDASVWEMARAVVHEALQKRALSGSVPPGFPVDRVAQLLVERLYRIRP